METWCGIVQWFYGQTDLIYVNSEFYRRCWIDAGSRRRSCVSFTRSRHGTFQSCVTRFGFLVKQGAKVHASLRGPHFQGKGPQPARGSHPLAARKTGAFTLAIVGEGPYRAELEKLLPEAIFTGILNGRELGVAYASADLFVFPSTTDTYGNAVVEAMAAGLPVAVSDIGGPRELVKSPQMGRIFPARDVSAWVKGLTQMLAKPLSPEERLALARQAGGERRWDSAFAKFWADGQ